MLGSCTFILRAPRLSLSSGEHWKNRLYKKSVCAQGKKPSTKAKLSNSNESLVSLGKQGAPVLFIFCVDKLPGLGPYLFWKPHPPRPQLTAPLSPWLSWEVMIDGCTPTLLGGVHVMLRDLFLINSHSEPFHPWRRTNTFMFMIYGCINKWLENC